MFVYAPPNQASRQIFWGHFKCMVAENEYPWVCIGDFNEIRLIEEKEGGAECRMSQLQYFLELLSDCALIIKDGMIMFVNDWIERLLPLIGELYFRTLRCFMKFNLGPIIVPRFLIVLFLLKRFPRCLNLNQCGPQTLLAGI